MAMKPAGEVLRGLDIEELPEAETPLDLVSLIKTLDDEGEVQWYVRATSGVSDLELMGALMMELDRRRYHKASTFLDGGDE